METEAPSEIKARKRAYIEAHFRSVAAERETAAPAESSAARIARQMSDWDLLHVARALNAELEATMLAGQPGSPADLGRLELVQACTDELVARGYVKGRKADGSDLPRLVQWEDRAVKLSQPVLVF